MYNEDYYMNDMYYDDYDGIYFEEDDDTYYDDYDNIYYYEDYNDLYYEEEGGNMNNYNLINLYEKRKKDQIQKKYEEKIKKEYNQLETVKTYYELIEKFEKDLNELVEKHNTENNKVFRKINETNFFKYEINPDLYNKIEAKYLENLNKELATLRTLVEEVKAQLNLSANDKDYQIEILTKYNILNKDGFLNV